MGKPQRRFGKEFEAEAVRHIAMPSGGGIHSIIATLAEGRRRRSSRANNGPNFKTHRRTVS